MLWRPLVVLAVVTGGLGAQGKLDDYRRAAAVNQIYAGKTVGLVQGPTWVGTGGFWYRVSVAGGNRFVFVDADAWTKQPAFDHARLAASLARATNGRYTDITLPFNTFTYLDGRQAIEANVSGGKWRCTLADYACTRTGDADSTAAGGRGGRGAAAGAGGRGGGAGRAGGPGGVVDDPCTPATEIARTGLRVARGAGGGRGRGGAGGGTGVRSPDGKWEAFVQNNNVFMRAAGAPAGAAPVQMSTEGTAEDAYRQQSIQWAPDSRKFMAYRQTEGTDRRITYVRSSPPNAPKDDFQPCVEMGPLYRKPGDVLPLTRATLFDVEAKKETIIDNALFRNPYQIETAQWRRDSRSVTFAYNQRGHAAYRIIEVNGSTGQPRALINEESKTFIQYRPPAQGLTDGGHTWRRDLDDGREIIWMSERDGWAHLYLYDGITGQVKNQITKGNWLVKNIESVDSVKRQIYFSALGMNPGQDPYFEHFYRINFDGTGLVKYTEGDGSHSIVWSPDRRYYIDTYSRVDMPPVVELRRASDLRMLPLEKGDMSAALATGWKPPEVFHAKGRDGTTDIWGLIVRPQTFDPNKKYPVIEQIYAGPQGSFVPKTWGGGQALLSTAELGFVLVQIDGMGTANRSKAFHDVAWKNLADAGFPDRILWMKAAAAKYSWFDITRVGVYGTSAGGQNALGALLFHGDFYKVANANSGCHDNRMDKIWWNELWMGEMGPHYAANSNVDNATKLTGHLFLTAGEMDNNVDPSSTMQVVDKLATAGKDFDFLLVPNGGHGAMGTNGTRKRNDFFVRWLLGVTPPDWNSGITIPAAGRAGGPGGAGRTTTLGALIQFPDDEPPPYGFFESPADDKPPHWWW